MSTNGGSEPPERSVMPSAVSTNVSGNRPSPVPEPWCRECGVPIVDTTAHDRWHARFEGMQQTPRCCSLGHEDVPAYYVGTYEDDREYPNTAYCKKCGDSMIRTGEYSVDRVLTNGASTTADSSVTRSEVSTNLSTNDPSRTTS